jgi:hypothetical protein
MTALFPVPDGLDGLDGLADLGVGSQILDAVHEFGCRYVAFPNEAAAVAWTLWVGHTHLIHHFDSTPRLAVISAEKQSGKTRLLEVTETVVPRPLRSASVTAAVIFRTRRFPVSATNTLPAPSVATALGLENEADTPEAESAKTALLVPASVDTSHVDILTARIM